MSLIKGFDAEEVEPQVAGELLPDGWYPAIITRSTTKITNSGNGQYLELEFQVIDGPAKSRRVWDRLNLDNPNATAVEIARASLSAICHAVGVLKPKSEDELHDKPLEIKVATQPAKGEYGPSNVVKGYRPMGKGGAKTVARNSRNQPVDRSSLPVEDDDKLPF
jgi:hypothetical protein